MCSVNPGVLYCNPYIPHAGAAFQPSESTVPLRPALLYVLAGSNTKGFERKSAHFGTYGVSVTLIRLADRPPLAQKWVLARSRCIQANGHDTRRDTVLQSSAATLPKSSAATAMRTEIASQRSSLLQISGCRGRVMAVNSHTGTASCTGAARRAADAFAALLRLLQPARRRRGAGSTLIRS